MTCEAWLYQYPRDKARLELLRLRLASLSSVAGQSYDALGGGSGDPVAERAAKVNELERQIAALEGRTRPVEALLAFLESDGDELRRLGEIVRRRYFRRESWKEMQWGMSVSRATLHRRLSDLHGLLEGWPWE